MKIIKFIFILTITSTLFFCCGATKDKTMYALQKKPPFKVINAEVSDWVGGQPGVRGLKVSISIDNKNIKLDSLYFRNQKTALELLVNSNPSTYIGIFVTSKGINDYIIDKDSTKEFGNSPKSTSKNIPFKINDNEAVVSYKNQTKRYYYKISKIKKIN
ncbi:MAG: hypothetical protein R3342_08825 [Lutibacter sp.]|uniref:hypothetical protein n=1 Tax=Lutibacter sp. TaxID=1925666 RepID=UPI00299CF6D0|nr:hypothetical protein [Lutibacter sp.]MDX1829635.1 hypothetical protein [Lutibacter sp.]